MDTEDKLSWCDKFGEKAESAFVDRINAHAHGVSLSMNPEKTHNVYVHDIFSTFQSDVKTVRTPLFKAKEMFGVDPSYAVTFNHKDYTRYQSLYPNIIIFFDIDFSHNTSMEIRGVSYSVLPTKFVCFTTLHQISRLIKSGAAKTITYSRRVGLEDSNAKSSYVIDSRYFYKVKGNS